MPVKTDREYRAMAECRIADGEEYRVYGYATTWDDPYVLYEYEDGNKFYEKIDRGALDEADKSDVIMQYDHQGKVLARMSNGTLNLREDEKGLYMEADLSKSEAARAMYEEIRNGLVTKMSWAFTVAEDKYNKETRTRTITRVKKVYDVSAVSLPANPDTEISARTYAQGRLDAEAQELRERKRKELRRQILMEVANEN